MERASTTPLRQPFETGSDAMPDVRVAPDGQVALDGQVAPDGRRAPNGRVASDGSDRPELPGNLGSDSAVAAKNAATLGASLTLTWAIALVAQIVSPRILGSDGLGVVRYSEALAQLLMVSVAFGIDTYVRREVSVRPEHAREFAGGIVLVRLALTGLLMAFGGLVMLLAGHGAEFGLFALFLAALFFLNTAQTSAAFLHAVGTVGGVARANVMSKVVWAVALLGGFAVGLRGVAVPIALLVAEGLKAALLGRQAKHVLGLTWSFDTAVLRRVVLASLPFFFTQLNGVLSSTLDPVLLRELTGSEREVGLYDVAIKTAGLALLVSPVIQWVMMPLVARSAARSATELNTVMRRSLQYVLSLSIPIATMMAIGADLLITVFGGDEYRPAAPALRILCVMFVSIYVSMLGGSFLVQLNRGWVVARITFVCIVANALANLLLIRPALRWWGVGGAGRMAAITFVLSETAIAIGLFLSVGRRAFDAGVVRNTSLTLVSCAAAFGLDRILHRADVLGEGLAGVRVALVGVVLLANLLITRTLDVTEIRRFLRIRRLEWEGPGAIPRMPGRS